MRLKDNRTGKAAKYFSSVDVSLDSNYLVFTFNSKHTTFNSFSDKYNSTLYKGDVVELFLSVGKENYYYEIEVAPNNTLFVALIYNDGKEIHLHKLKNTFVESKVKTYKDGYKTTLKINLLKIDGLVKNIEFNCFRIETEGRKTDLNLFALSPTMSGSFHKREYFVKLTDYLPTLNTSINTGFLAEICDAKKEIQILKDAGFDAYDFSFDICWGKEFDTFINHKDYKKRAKELRKYADKIGIKCNQAHAPFRILPKDGTKKDIEEQFKRIVRSFECASILGARGIVLHPINEFPVKKNVKILNRFLPFAKKYNLVILIENMWCWSNELDHATPAACSHPDSFNELLDKLDSHYFKALLDVGHAEMFYPELNASMMIHSLGDRLFGLHIHDNDQYKDLHRIPGECKINFDDMLIALKEINYKGDLTLEIMDWTEIYRANKLENVKLASKIVQDMKEALL